MADIVKQLRALESQGEDYIWRPAKSAAEEIETLRAALMESVILQSHYAQLLNDYDGGERLEFATIEDWIARLRVVNRLPPI